MPQVLVDFEGFRYVREDFVVDFSTSVFCRPVVVGVWFAVVAISFSRVPTSILEADSGSWACAGCKEKVVDKVGRNMVRIIAFSSRAVIKFYDLAQH